MKDPIKYARKELPKLGAVLVADRGFLVEFDIPYGGRLIVDKRMTLPRVRSIVASVRERLNPLYGYEPIPVTEYVVDNPTISNHFMERFELMNEQDGLESSEVGSALSNPVRAYRAGQRIAFERGRVIVIIHRQAAGYRLITVLWADEKLWARNPRPGKE